MVLHLPSLIVKGFRLDTLNGGLLGSNGGNSGFIGAIATPLGFGNLSKG
jgi:hypothetical protein